MGRKRVLTNKEILEATGKILRQEGIKGVHFKKLADMLEVSRSTFYEYYKNKEQLILAYMKSMMLEMDEKIDRIAEDLPPNQKLYELLIIFLEHAHIHHIDQMIRELQSSDKSLALFYQTELQEDLMKTYDLMIGWIEESKQQKIWKTNVEADLIGDLIFHSILLPSRQKLGVDHMVKQLFKMIEQGVINGQK